MTHLTQAEIKADILAMGPPVLKPTWQSEAWMDSMRQAHLDVCEAIRTDDRASFPAHWKFTKEQDGGTLGLREFIILLYLSTALGIDVPRMGRAQIEVLDQQAMLRRYWWHPRVARAILAQRLENPNDLYTDCLAAWMSQPQASEMLYCALQHVSQPNPRPFYDKYREYADKLEQAEALYIFSGTAATGYVSPLVTNKVLFFLFAYRPDLAVALGTTRLRRFPSWDKLSELLPNPAAATQPTLVDFYSWRHYGRDFEDILTSYGFAAPVATVISWDWHPERVTLPLGSVTVTPTGVLTGSHRLAWYIGNNKLVTIQSKSNAKGRLLAAFCAQRGIDVLWIFPTTPNTKEPIQLTAETTPAEALVALAVRCPTAFALNRLLNHCRDAADYPAMCDTMRPFINTWIQLYIYQHHNYAIYQVFDRYGTMQDLNQLLEHFPEIIPPPIITTALTVKG